MNQTTTIFPIKEGKAIFRSMPHKKTLSMGILIGAGSTNESSHQFGYAHFVEHMVFKGTPSMTFVQINKEFEKLGAYINAFTDKYYTLFYVQALADYAIPALKLLLDIVFNSTFPEQEVAKEKNVILEELEGYNDNPDDKLIENIYEQTFKGSFLAHSILGTRESLEKANRDSLLEFYHEHYTLNNAIFSFAGQIKEEEIKELLIKYDFPERKNTPTQKTATPVFKNVFHTEARKIEQVHFALGIETFSLFNPLKEELKIWNMILGGMSSSRLYLSIREEQALCYGIESSLYLDPYTGMLSVFGGTQPDNISILLESIVKELLKIKSFPPQEEEILIAKNQLSTQLAFKEESHNGIMIKQASELFFYKEVFSTDSLLEKIKNVSPRVLAEVSDTLITENTKLSFVGIIPTALENKINMPTL